MSVQKQPWQDASLPFETRARDLVDRMTIEEKMSQIRYRASALYRFGIPEYSWWGECLHGVACAGHATLFPQVIGMAATFHPELIKEVADVISTEARAKHHENERFEDRYDFKSLTYWSPNINIFRDPRWGRGHETYGEDPYLTGRMGVAFVQGLQGDDPKYLKVVSTPKHYAAHSGPESLRRGFNAVVSEKDLRETYLPAFKECVQEGGAYSVMGAYNALNGEVCCGSPTLLQKILRDEWGFEGYVVSDCYAVMDFHEHHHVTQDAAESAALALNNGLDLNCGIAYEKMEEALERGLVTEEAIDRACYRVMLARMKLGMFDSAEECTYARIPFEVNDCDEHHEICLQTARESLVLLKNDGILPLERETLKNIAIIGPNAHSKDVLLGNYNPDPSIHYTVVDGMRALCPDVKITYNPGCTLHGGPREKVFMDVAHWNFAESMAIAKRADVVVMVMGLDHTMEGEQGASKYSEDGDKGTIALPETQMQLFEEVARMGKPMIVVNLSGSAVDMRVFEAKANAIIQGWYPGQFGGLAIAETLLGMSNPSGRLPITFYKDMSQVPDFANYSMEGRTYRFMQDAPTYPFGYGLSYTQFKYENIRLSSKKLNAGEPQVVKVMVTNVGELGGMESVQLYLKDMAATTRVPRYALQGLQKVVLEPGESAEVAFTVSPRQMAVIRDDGSCVLEPGDFTVYVGGQQPDARSAELTGTRPLEAVFTITGNDLPMVY